MATSYVGDSSMGPPRNSRSYLSGSTASSAVERLAPYYLEFKWKLLLKKSLFDRVLSTLVNSKTLTTSRVHLRVWSAFLRSSKVDLLLSSQVPISQVLNFMQQDLNKGLSLSLIKVQISSLGALFKVVDHPREVRFVRAVSKRSLVNIPTILLWDFSLVLSASIFFI